MLLIGAYFLRKDTVSQVREFWIRSFTEMKAEMEDQKNTAPAP